MKKHKMHVKAANMLVQALYELKQERLLVIQQKFEGFSCKCSGIPKHSRKYSMAVSRCWYKSAEKIRSRISRDLNDFSHQLEQFINTINAEDIRLPKLGDVVAEMLQIEDEFGEIKFDLKAMTISIITETIALEEITFGSFEIRLYLNDIKKLAFESPYKIIALDPNPAGSDYDVTHPHVSHEKLCEGDGFIPIRKAIQQGRLSDFFTIIVQILQTYNPDSPYVSLDDWEGTSCYDCGYTVSGDDCYYCEECDRDYCSNCSTYCQICDTTVCLGCSYECPGCNKPVCEHCTDVCVECNEQFCKDCLNNEGLCNNCQEQRKEQEDEKLKEESTTPKAEPEIQSDSVGETRISA
ncbi:MAG: hypothetical protein FVQ82_08125 [Planctomycetes bacterium]|nr:hypothetical protein [Planctomycetota bacterium]